MSESFLHELHSRFSAPRDAVLQFVEQVIGSSVESLSRVVRGYDNEVYRTESVDSGAVYIRIRPDDCEDRAFELEAWAMEKARDAGVPVPEVLAIDRIATVGARREAMVVRAAPGLPLESMIGGLSERDRHTVLVNLGRTLGQLHSVGMPGMWRPDQRGHWPSPDDLCRGFIAERRTERRHLVRAGLTDAEIEHTYSVLQEFPGPGPIGPVLCHGDIGPDHVFIDSALRVSGMIDWGMWHGGSIIGELAYLLKKFPADDFEAVLEGHGSCSADDPGFRRKIAASLAQQQIGHIAHHVIIGDEQGVRRNLSDLRRALAEL